MNYANLYKRLLDQEVATMKDTTITIAMSDEEAQDLRVLFEAEKAELVRLDTAPVVTDRADTIAELETKIAVLPVKEADPEAEKL